MKETRGSIAHIRNISSKIVKTKENQLTDLPLEEKMVFNLQEWKLEWDDLYQVSLKYQRSGSEE